MTTKNKNLQPFLIKEQLIVAIRQFFQDQNFHEIIVPILNKGLPLEPNLYSFSTQWQYLDNTDRFYLPTSPEAALKKTLAKGVDKVFSIGHSFRNREPSDLEHHPEFLMLEWYRADADYEQIMEDIELLINYLADDINKFLNRKKSQKIIYQDLELELSEPFKRISLVELFEKKIGKPLTECLSISAIKGIAKDLGFSTKNSTWEQLFNQIFLEKIEPTIGNQPTFLTDFPAQISPLCKSKKKQSDFAQRFEFYLAGVEIGNGNTEQTDVDKVKKAFHQEKQYRIEQNLPLHPIDQEFLKALELLHKTGKSFAGVGLGVDRLAMIFADIDSIDQFLI